MKTIHEMRVESARQLADMLDGDVARATHILNCVYRYAHADIAQFYCDNDSRLYNEAQSEREGKRLAKLRSKIQTMLKPYGLRLENYGLYPCIVDHDSCDKHLLHWYD